MYSSFSEYLCAPFCVLSISVQDCFLLDAANFKLKERFSLEEIQQITVTSKTDGMVLLRLPVDGPNARVRQLYMSKHA